MARSEKAQKAFDKLVRDTSGFEPSLKKFISQYMSLVYRCGSYLDSLFRSWSTNGYQIRLLFRG